MIAALGAHARRHQSGRHQSAGVFLHRARTQEADEDPCLPRRSAWHRDYFRFGTDQRPQGHQEEYRRSPRGGASGAGAAAIACLDLWCEIGVKREHITVCDSKGVIYVGRDENMEPTKAKYAQQTDARTLKDALVGADVFLGLSAAGALKAEWRCHR